MARSVKSRVAYGAAVLLLIAIAAWVALFSYRAGLLRSVDGVGAQACLGIGDFVGPEDIVVDRERGLAYVTSADRFGVMRQGAPPGGDIKLLRLDEIIPRAVSLRPLPAASFFPHGLDLWIDPSGERWLFAINHGASGYEHSVEIFRITPLGRLIHSETVTSPAFTDPNDLVVVGSRQFYVTNLYGSSSKLGRFLESYLMIPHADVVYFDGEEARPVIKGLSLANGIAASADLETIYVAEVLRRRVTAYARDFPSGTLTAGRRVTLEMGPDNLSRAPDGAIWVAGHPKLLQMSVRLGKEGRASASEVVRIDWDAKGGPTAKSVFRDRGEVLSAASVATEYGGALYIGSVFGRYLLKCDLEKLMRGP